MSPRKKRTIEKILKKRKSKKSVVDVGKPQEVIEEAKRAPDLNEYFRRIRESTKEKGPVMLFRHSPEDEIRNTLRTLNENALRFFIQSRFERWEPLNIPERLKAVKELKEKINRFKIPSLLILSEEPEFRFPKETKKAVSRLSRQASRVAKKEVTRKILDPEIERLERLLKPRPEKVPKPVKVVIHPPKNIQLEMAKDIFIKYRGSENQIPELRRLIRKSRKKGLDEETLRLLREQTEKAGYGEFLLPLIMDERKGKLTKTEKKFFGIE